MTSGAWGLSAARAAELGERFGDNQLSLERHPLLASLAHRLVEPGALWQVRVYCGTAA